MQKPNNTGINIVSEHKDKNKAESNDETKTSDNVSGAGGEDDSSTEIEGDDSHLHEDQKSRRLSSAVDTSKAQD
jgi:hypothetical protein